MLIINPYQFSSTLINQKMDSLTQIVLGAACGEVVAGKKLGNRAMLWGAVGGTIPDLDVLAVFFTDEIASTSFHRGFMHSFLFAALAPWVFAWLTRWFYHNNIYRLRSYKAWAMGIWLLFFFGAAAAINFIPVLVGEGLSFYVLLPTIAIGIWLARKLWNEYWRRDLPLVEAPYLTWVALFFLSIFTHPILDCCTNYGTQIWQPFSDLRVQWNTISVVDPLATIPFGLFLVLAAKFQKNEPMRATLAWLGVAWFVGYVGIYASWHKVQANRIFRQTLEEQDVRHHRFMTNPTIFNNIVWHGVAEDDTAFYYGLYGFNDQTERYAPFSVIPKNHHLLEGIPPDARALRFLRWFSDDYFNVMPYNGDTLQVNDLRFGLLGDSILGNNYVFPFLLFKNEKGEWDAKQNNRNRSSVKGSEESFQKLWERIVSGRK